MTIEGDDLLAWQAALQRALVSKHDPTSRMIKAHTDRTQGHRVGDGIEWCVDEFCPINRAAEELRTLRIGPTDAG